MFPEIRIEPIEPNPVMYCPWCGEPMYEGEYAYTIDGEEVCEACATAWLDDKKRELEMPARKDEYDERND